MWKHIRIPGANAGVSSTRSVIPELVETVWYEWILHNHEATALKARLLLLGDPTVVVINVPWYYKKKSGLKP